MSIICAAQQDACMVVTGVLDKSKWIFVLPYFDSRYRLMLIMCTLEKNQTVFLSWIIGDCL